MILETYDRRTMTKMEIALEGACDRLSTGSQKHRSRRYIAKRIIRCASGGDRDLASLTAAAVAAAKKLNASRSNRRRSTVTTAEYPTVNLSRLAPIGARLRDGSADEGDAQRTRSILRN
jgi:hypothetical protein